LIKTTTLHKLQTRTIAAGALFVAVYILQWGDFSSSASIDEFGFTLGLLATLVPIIFFFGLSLFPYAIFYKITKSIFDRGGKETYSKASFLVTVVLIPVCCWGYVAAGQSIRNDTSSTASLVFAVLPFYIAIVGSAFYGVIYMLARKGS
jgi:drug/metabolite transporter (DMT)-like permease